MVWASFVAVPRFLRYRVKEWYVIPRTVESVYGTRSYFLKFDSDVRLDSQTVSGVVLLSEHTAAVKDWCVCSVFFFYFLFF